jgi:hypothetical protein
MARVNELVDVFIKYRHRRGARNTSLYGGPSTTMVPICNEYINQLIDPNDTMVMALYAEVHFTIITCTTLSLTLFLHC